MGKNYFIFAAALMALASCSSDDILGGAQTGGNETSEAIQFAGETGKITRADKTDGDAATALDNNFVVVGYKGSATDVANTTLVFDHYNVNYKENTSGTTESNTKNWEYVGQDQNVKGLNNKLATSAGAQTIKYWDHSVASYDFLAFSLGKGHESKYAIPTAVTKNNKGQLQYTLKGDVNLLSECYISNITTVKETDYKNKTVNMNFRHATSKVRIALFETVPGYVISDVKFHSSATAEGTSENGQFYGTFNKQGTMTVYFPTTGTNNSNNPDYNQAHVSFTPQESDGTETVKEFGTLNYNNQKEDQIEAGKGYLSQSAANPSYCGTSTYYKTVLPAEDASQPATIRIDYKLTSTDGSQETINVKNATATIPAAYTAWKPGYAYTYKFKISQNTNGSTGGDDKGLTAITFDAVVLDDMETGKQETITTVSDPSITTYGYKDGKVTVDGEEYAAGTEIYATVQVPEYTVSSTEGENNVVKATTKAPTALYTVTLTAGENASTNAVQTINESSVANAIAKGGSVIDINNWTLAATKVTTGTEKVTKVPTQDGHELTVYALKWIGTANTVYAVEYSEGSNKTYKIVTVK